MSRVIHFIDFEPSLLLFYSFLNTLRDCVNYCFQNFFESLAKNDSNFSSGPKHYFEDLLGQIVQQLSTLSQI